MLQYKTKIMKIGPKEEKLSLQDQKVNVLKPRLDLETIAFCKQRKWPMLKNGLPLFGFPLNCWCFC